MEKRAVKIVRIDDIRRGERAALFIGREHGAEISFWVMSQPRGESTRPHRHPHAETFVVQEGAAEFTVDGDTLRVDAGTIIIVPAGAVHCFKPVGDGMTRQINIHSAAEIVTEWLD